MLADWPDILIVLGLLAAPLGFLKREEGKDNGSEER
jgi:hypothetical protein